MHSAPLLPSPSPSLPLFSPLPPFFFSPFLSSPSSPPPYLSLICPVFKFSDTKFSNLTQGVGNGWLKWVLGVKHLYALLPYVHSCPYRDYVFVVYVGREVVTILILSSFKYPLYILPFPSILLSLFNSFIPSLHPAITIHPSMLFHISSYILTSFQYHHQTPPSMSSELLTCVILFLFKVKPE